jgi:hypothetical protein
MKTIIKSLIFLSLSFLATAEEQSASADALQLKPLVEALDKGGLVNLNSYLDEGGKWPRITTDSFATKNKITNQKELVALSDHLVGLLRDRVEAKPSSEIKALESEAKLLFALSEKLWKADGYRNRIVSLLCCDLASHRCGNIIIVSRGEKVGPQRPDVFKVRNSVDMLNLFIAMIPEHKDLSGSGFDKVLVDTPVKGETWLEMIAALRKIELGESTVGKKFNETVALPFSFLGTNLSKENIGALVFDYGWEQVMYESMLPALAMYLKNGGSLDILLKEPTNAKKFEDIMKNGIYRFSLRPVMSGIVDGDQVAGLVETVQNPERLSQRLFGIKK